MSVGYVVPSYALSEAEVAELIESIDLRNSEILFVLNGIDPSPQLTALLPDGGRIHRIHFLHPLGKAEAIRQGLHWMTNRGHQTIVQLDGHGKQSAGQAPLLISRLAATSSDLVLASRYSQSTILDGHRRAITSFMTAIVRVATGLTLDDAVCGMRAYSSGLAHTFATSTRSSGYGLEIEQVILATTSGHRIETVTVQSDPQDRNTAAEKLLDNVTTLLWCSAEAFDSGQSCSLHSLATAIKLRRSHTVAGCNWGMSQDVLFRYAGKDNDGEDAYTLRLQNTTEYLSRS